MYGFAGCCQQGRRNLHPARGQWPSLYGTLQPRLESQPTPREGTKALPLVLKLYFTLSQPTPRKGPNEQKTHTCTVCVFAVKESLFSKNQRPTFCRWAFQFVEKVHPLPRGEGGPEGVGRGMRAEIQKSAPFKDLLKSWFLDENAHKYLDFLCPKFPPDFLFSLASLDSFPPGGSHWVLPHQRVLRQPERPTFGRWAFAHGRWGYFSFAPSLKAWPTVSPRTT